MNILNNNYKSLLSNFFKKSNDEIIIVSAYITSDAINNILENINDNIKIILIARWQKADILSGSSDLKSYYAIKKRKGKFYWNKRLHAKIYMKDKSFKLFGSANLTSRGIGLLSPDLNNIEYLSGISKVTEEDIIFVNDIIRDSIEVTDELVDELQNQMESEAEDWDNRPIDKIKMQPKGIFVNDFPFSSKPKRVLDNSDLNEVIHDKKIFQISEPNISFENLKLHFENSTIIKWLDKQFDESIHFGKLSSLIHNALLDDPKPYRKDIKKLQKNLFKWIQDLLKDKYKIKQPGQSQVLIKLKTQ